MTSVRAILRLLRTSLAFGGVMLIGLWVMEPIDVVRNQSWDLRKEQWLIDCVPTAGDGGAGQPGAPQNAHLLPSPSIAWVAAPANFLCDDVLPAGAPPVYEFHSAFPASPHRPAAHLRGPPCA